VSSRKHEIERAKIALRESFLALKAELGSQIRAAEACGGVNQSLISRILNGKGGVNMNTLIYLRWALKKPLDEILNLDPLPNRPGKGATLDEVIDYFPGRWSREAVAAARAVLPGGYPIQGWEKVLDIQEQLARGSMPQDP
jgi:hypothetical protein